MKKHKAAGIVPYIVEDDPYHPKVLLIKNDLGWEFPKGRVESNETTLTAAIRETKEETGLSDLKIHHRFRHISKYNITKNFSTGEKLEAPEPKQVTYFPVRKHDQILCFYQWRYLFVYRFCQI